MTTKKYIEYIKNNTLRVDASRRGGGIEIGVAELFGIEGAKISAYQNYLGGGMLGAIQANANFEPTKKDTAKFYSLTGVLKRYFHAITNEEAGDYDSWNASSYEANQTRPVSGY